MRRWAVAWLPFMASPFDQPGYGFTVGVDQAQALDNARILHRLEPLTMMKLIELDGPAIARLTRTE